MNDESSDLESFEKDCRQWRPAQAPADLRPRLAAALSIPIPSRLSDRCLWSAIGMGLAAAITIAVLTGQDRLASPAPQVSPLIAARALPQSSNDRQWLALLTQAGIPSSHAPEPKP